MRDIKMWLCMKAWNVLWKWWPDRIYTVSPISSPTLRIRHNWLTTSRAEAEKMADLGFPIMEKLDFSGRKVEPKEPH